MRVGEFESWRVGELQSRRVGELESCRVGELESCRVGEFESWRVGELESWRVGANLPVHLPHERDDDHDEGVGGVLHRLRAHRVDGGRVHGVRVHEEQAEGGGPHAQFVVLFGRRASRAGGERPGDERLGVRGQWGAAAKR